MLPLVFLAPLVASNASLTFPIPKGYVDVSAEIVKQTPALAKSGVIAIAKGTAASINLVPTEHAPDADLADAKECTAFADEMTGRLHAEAPTSSIVEGPAGKTCQIALTYRKPKNLVVVSTILRGPTTSWMMTCTQDPKDAAARQVCRDVIASIKFK